MTTEFTAGDDLIDVRDVISRVEELRSERDSVQEDIDNAVDDLEVDAAEGAMEAWAADNAEELSTLESLLENLCGCGGDEQWEGDWYPQTLIHENHFESYMDQMLDDIGDIPKDLPSYLTITVDYDALKQDYSEVEYEGETYYYR